MHEPTSRELPFEPGNSGMLVIDMQNLCAVRGQGDDRQNPAPPDDYYYSRLEQLVVPNIQKLISGFRRRRIEVMYTVIQSLTKDGRDRSLDSSTLSTPPTSWFPRQCPRGNAHAWVEHWRATHRTTSRKRALTSATSLAIDARQVKSPPALSIKIPGAGFSK